MQSVVADGLVEEDRPSGMSTAVTLVTVCALAYFVDGLVHSILGPLAPDIARTLNLSKAELGPVFSANLVGQCIGLVLVPLFIRRLGHRRIVVWSLVGFGIAQTLSAFADGQHMLILLRVAAGFFLGGTLPSCLALVVGGVPLARRGTAISGLFTGYALGSIVSGVLGSLFTAPEGWRTAMALVGGLCLLTAAVAFLFLVEPRRDNGPNEDAAPARAALSVLSRRYLLGTLMLWVMFACMLTINYCLGSWLPILLTDVGRGKSIAALSIAIFTAGGLVATVTIGPLMDRFGVQRILIGFLLASIVGLFAIGQALQTAPLWVLVTLLVVTGFFNLGSYGGVNVVLVNFYPDALRAIGIGCTKSIGRVGTVIAPVLIGLGLTAGVTETTIMSMFALPALFTTIAVLMIGGTTRRRSTSGQEQESASLANR
jgi:MFS family permease